MDFTYLIHTVTDFISQHQHLALGVIFLLAFGESLAFISLLLPATVILLATGALIGESELTFFTVWLSAAVGAFCGDWLSWWLGFHYSERVIRVWPLSRQPQLIARGHAFFERWGTWGVFIGRFFGPLRAVVPLVAGICAMPSGKFQLANGASAAVWAFGILAPGALGIPWLAELFS
ncbi:DedA family protein [[Enterobacter] lignolyticus]|uniref:SNARE associated Golgi protein-related protein n=1 Tax=Enterobacter lignolyticus (strain SCF1) TaxID=701347 RepID=E3G594_ENTLS|nr:DedA family protein [[Enterobacter] lignolyticus]ADO48342.1 SNARE associated Golgi protein-related protein [[Enterobacter] lignolyticus SCF1]